MRDKKTEVSGDDRAGNIDCLGRQILAIGQKNLMDARAK